MEVVQTLYANTVNDLFGYLDPRSEAWADGEWIFRGHGDERWGLVPRAFRPDWYPRKIDTEMGENCSVLTQASMEWLLLQAFVREANECGLRLARGNESVLSTTAGDLSVGNFIAEFEDKYPQPHMWPPHEDLPNLALAQHHGIPTRLLDWSKSSYVAAYFAAATAAAFDKRVEHPPNGWTHFSIWALDRRKLSMFEVAKEPFACIVTLPRSGNPNLHAQSGLFTYYWDNSPIKVGDLFKPQPFESAIEERTQDFLRNRVAKGGLVRLCPVLIRINVPGQLAGAILRDLVRFGVSASKLFPGYDGVARAIVERRLWS